MRWRRMPGPAARLLILVLAGCGQRGNWAVEQAGTEPAESVVRNDSPPQKLYEGAIPQSGQAKLLIMANMN